MRLHRVSIEWRRIAQYEPIRVEGAAAESKEGMDRQQLVWVCHPGMRVALRREPESPLGPNTVAICTLDDRQISYLPVEAAKSIAPLMDSGRAAFDAEIWSVDRSAKEGESSLSGFSVALTQFELASVERFSLAFTIGAVVLFPATTVKWTVSHLALLLQSFSRTAMRALGFTVDRPGR